MGEPEDGDKFGEPEFLGWYILHRLKALSDDQISRSKFLKLSCIADRYIAEKYNHEVSLPRYWYMYGELANEHEFSGRFYNAPKAIGWDGQQIIPKQLNLEAFDISKDSLEIISEGVRRVVKQFGNENVEEIKRHQYQEHAEIQFIREYSELRWLLNTIDLGSQTRLNSHGELADNKQYVLNKLDTLVREYPENIERFDDMRPLFLRWDDTVRMMLDRDEEFSRVAESLDSFIETLSKVVLRFEFSQNIPSSRFEKWEKTAADSKSEFATNLREQRKELYQGRSRSPELDKVSETYSETIEKRIEEILAGQ